MRAVFIASALLMAALTINAAPQLPLDATETALVARYGESQRERAHRGLRQVADFWRAEDGDAAAFAEFAATNLAGDAKTLDALFERMQRACESLDGHMLEIGRDWKEQSDLDRGAVLPFDETMAAYDPSAHVND